MCFFLSLWNKFSYVFIEHEFCSIILSNDLIWCNQITMFMWIRDDSSVCMSLLTNMYLSFECRAVNSLISVKLTNCKLFCYEINVIFKGKIRWFVALWQWLRSRETVFNMFHFFLSLKWAKCVCVCVCVVCVHFSLNWTVVKWCRNQSHMGRISTGVNTVCMQNAVGKIGLWSSTLFQRQRRR